MMRIITLLAALFFASSALPMSPQYNAVLFGGAACAPATLPTPVIEQSANMSSFTVFNAVGQLNAVKSPACGFSGGFIREDTSNSTHEFFWTHTITVPIATYTATIYAKQIAGNRQAAIRMSSSGSASTATTIANLGPCSLYFNSVTGTWTTSSGTVTPAGNGWCKITATFTTVASDTAITAEAFNVQPLGGQNYTGDGVSTVAFWGFTF